MDFQNNPSTKVDVYQVVTNRMIEILEGGTVPWQKPWTDAGVPMNMISKRPYRGINLWLLLSLNYERNLFLTWDQLKRIGGSVLQGQHGHVVAFWKNIKKVPEELDDQKNPRTVSMLRYYKVFNIEQCKDVPPTLIEPLVIQGHDSLLECEAVVQGMPNPPALKFKEPRAFYHVEQDYINIPKKKNFKNIESYYSTLFHELVHSTGSEKRLGRKTITEMSEFGSEAYSMEELIAEMGASFLSSFTGILEKEIQNSAAYLQGWLEKLKNDKRFIIQASGHAQKAADMILNRQDENLKDDVMEIPEESMVS